MSCKETGLLLGVCLNTPIDGQGNVHEHLVFNVKNKLLVLNVKGVVFVVKAKV